MAMIDTVAKIYDYLTAADSYGFSAAVSTRVTSPVLPADYASAAAAVTFQIVRERTHESGAQHYVQANFKCYGVGPTPTAARTVYRLLHDKLHSQVSSANKIVRASQVTAAQTLTDPGSEVPYVAVTYALIFDR